MPPAAIASSVAVTSSSSPRRSRSSSAEAGGNFGAPPKPPCSGSKTRRSPRAASERIESVSGSLDGATSLEERTASTSRRAFSRDVLAPLAVGAGDRVQHLPEARQPVPRRRRVVRAAEERLALGREEDGHRPAAVPGQRDDRVHVDRVEVGALLAVDLDADELLVHLRGGLLVLERLVLHHVAPVARGVADREQDRPVLVARAGERLLAPRVPVDRVLRVLEEVGTGLGGEAVHSRTIIVRWRTTRPERSRSSSRTSRARRSCSSSSATSTRPWSPTTGASCARPSARPAGERSTRRATRSSTRSSARGTR